MTGFEVKRWTENLEPFTSVTVGNLTVQITRSSKSGMTLVSSLFNYSSVSQPF